MTVQTPQQFTPSQILDAGQRAEAEGRYDFALQFYRHLTAHYPHTREAAVAHEASQLLAQHRDDPRTGPPSGLARPEYANPNQSGRAAEPAGRRGISLSPAGKAAGAARAQSGFDPPPPRAQYRTGRALARLTTWLGGAMILTGVALLPIAVVNPRTFAGLPIAGITTPTGFALAIAGGLLAMLAGQLARAMFDLANAGRDMAALTRARAEQDSAEQQVGTRR